MRSSPSTPRRPRSDRRVAMPASFSGLAWSPDGDRLYVGGGFDDVDLPLRPRRRPADRQGHLPLSRPPPVPADPAPGNEQDVQRTGQRVPGGLALTADGKTLWVANVWGHTVARFDAETGALLGEAGTGDGTYPYGLAIDEDAGRVYASLWGAAAVGVIDSESGEVDRPSGRPRSTRTSCSWPARARSCTSPTPTGTPSPSSTPRRAGPSRRSAPPSPPTPRPARPRTPWPCRPTRPSCSSPTPTRTTSPSSTSRSPGESKPMGFLPVGWYPTCVRLSADGKTLYVTNGKGAMSKANRNGPDPVRPRAPTTEYIGGLFEGTLSIDPDARPGRPRRGHRDRLRLLPPRPQRPGRRRRRAARGQPGPREGRASRRRSGTASTSSRRTAPMIRSSATCPRATASRRSASSPIG